MTVLAPSHLEDALAYLEALRSDPLKDQSYRGTPLGKAAADYLSWKENEDGAAAATLDSYERALAFLCAQKPTVTPEEVTIHDLREVRDAFTKGQRRKATAIFRDFFKWLYEEGHASSNPSGRLRYPKKEQPPITDLFDDEEKSAIVTAQTDIMDKVGVLLLLRAGLRQAELRNLMVGDCNLAEKFVLVRRGKGGKPRRVPVTGETIRALDELFLTTIPGHDRARLKTEYLLCPLRGGRSKTRNPEKPMGKRGVHEWWYRCLERAELVDPGVTRGRRMHAARHTYATDLGRATGWNLAAVSKNLGHSSIAITFDTYSQFALDDQIAAAQKLPEIESV